MTEPQIYVSSLAIITLVLAFLHKFSAPITAEENWFHKSSRYIISLLILLTPVLYDRTVAEVAGDPRWYWAQLSAIALTVLYSAHCIMQRKNMELSFKFPLPVWATIGIVGMALLSTIDTESYIRSWFGIKNIVAYGLIFAFVYKLRQPQWYFNLIWLLLIGFVFNSLFGATNYLQIQSGLSDYFRQAAPPAATFANKNLLASYLAMLMPLTLWLIIGSKTRWKTILGAVCLTAGFTMLIYTRSRGSWLSLFAAFILFAIAATVHKPTRNLIAQNINAFKVGAVVVALVASFGFASIQSSGKEKAFEKSASEQLGSIAQMKNEDFQTRIAYNLNALKIIKDHPFNGVGIFAFHTIYPMYNHAVTRSTFQGYSIHSRPQRAHNDLMQAFIETGILGGASYILMFVGLMLAALQIANNKKIEDKNKLLVTFLAFSVLTIGINCLGDFPLQMPTAPIILWTFAGIMTGLYMMQDKPKLYGFNAHYTLDKSSFYVSTLAVVLIGSFVVNDIYHRYIGGKHELIAMAYVKRQQFNDFARHNIDKAHRYYPYNERTQEHRAVIYSKYQGSNPHTLSKAIDVIEEAAKYDPYSANVLINLGGRYLQRAQILFQQNRYAEAQNEAQKARKIFDDKLVTVADQSAEAYSIGGFAYYYLGDPYTAKKLFEIAMGLYSGYEPTQKGLALANQAIQLDQQRKKELNQQPK